MKLLHQNSIVSGQTDKFKLTVWANKKGFMQHNRKRSHITKPVIPDNLRFFFDKEQIKLPKTAYLLHFERILAFTN